MPCTLCKPSSTRTAGGALSRSDSGCCQCTSVGGALWRSQLPALRLHTQVHSLGAQREGVGGAEHRSGGSNDQVSARVANRA